MAALMLLPWEYGVRNLARRPVRTALTLLALATTICLVFVVVGFIRGLEQSLTISGDQDVVLVYSVNSEENLETSAISAQTPELLAASLRGIQRRYGTPCVSPELYLGTRIKSATGDSGLGLVRGVTSNTPLVRRNVQLEEGTWPRQGDVIVGKLAAAKLSLDPEQLSIGNVLEFEGRTWQIVGEFSAGGATYESELWCNLDDFQVATKRQDLSLVAALMSPGSRPAEVSLFCKERVDLELRALRESEYYALLQKHYQPVRMLAWLVVFLVSGAGIFAGLNMMYGAVTSRTRELATLQAIGYRRRAILLSLIQEGVLLAASASLISGTIAVFAFQGLAVRFTMGAFTLRIDSVAILLGCGVGLILGVLGALPPAFKALRSSVAANLRAI